MKTNNLTKKSLLMTMILGLSAIFSQSKGGHSPAIRGSAVGGYNPIFIPRRGKMKGYMRENRKCSFNKNR